MSCQETHERLPEWLAGQLASAEAATLEHHVEICGDCLAEADLLQATRAAFSPAALGERVEPDWAAMRQHVLRTARLRKADPGLLGRAGAWLAQALTPLRLKPALATGALLVAVCALSFSLTVGPYFYEPQNPSTLATLTVDEIEALSEALSISSDGDLLGAEPLDHETMREIAKMSSEELDRILKTL
ncbi:MAG: zf-HC2 domain-containing protein [Nitrospinae bacterium]|nr:zf-HC2 domain-containing protein [Nitrospinota bacterium]